MRYQARNLGTYATLESNHHSSVLRVYTAQDHISEATAVVAERSLLLRELERLLREHAGVAAAGEEHVRDQIALDVVPCAGVLAQPALLADVR
jgi:hypothetical protein